MSAQRCPRCHQIGFTWAVDADPSHQHFLAVRGLSGLFGGRAQDRGRPKPYRRPAVDLPPTQALLPALKRGFAEAAYASGCASWCRYQLLQA
jgi:hypothetical protein